ncbi:MAG: hypothetical protein ACK5RG_01285 [Cyclobacteriaceae bacterium]|jgi:hypothetical protein|nr:hypothetical protein [Flammeovirgaceae bacterium]
MKKMVVLLILFYWASDCYGQSKLVYLADGFDDNRNKWFEEVTAAYGFKIQDGHLVIDANTTSVHTFQNVGISKDDDFGMHARMIFFNGTSEGWMGVRFGMSEDAKKYLTFSYNNAQGFLITAHFGKKYEVLRQSKSTVIKPYDYNTLTVIKRAGEYQFLINDKQVYRDAIKPFFGPMIALYVSENMSLRVDEVQVFDPKKGKQRIVASQATMAKVEEKDVKDIILTEELPPDFQQFYNQFEKFAFPYDYSTVINQAKDVSQLPFVQKNYYQYELSTTRDHYTFALAILSVCQNGYTFLMGHKYTTGIQRVFRISIEAFDKKGNKLGSKNVGSTSEENGRYYQTLHFRVSQKAASVNFDVEETYFNGNVNKRLVSFNGDLCNLNSY